MAAHPVRGGFAERAGLGPEHGLLHFHQAENALCRRHPQDFFPAEPVLFGNRANVEHFVHGILT